MRLSGEYMTVNELAEKCVVSIETIGKACREGRVKAIKRGKSWFIPRLDGELFAQAYVKHNNGSTWEPDVLRKTREFRDTAPTGSQSLKLTIPGRTLRLIDAERKRRISQGGKINPRTNLRTSIIIEAIDRWLGKDEIIG